VPCTKPSSCSPRLRRHRSPPRSGRPAAPSTSGRPFPEDNTALPKSPVPAISIYSAENLRRVPPELARVHAEPGEPRHRRFFTVVQEGRRARAQAIVGTVRQRFSKMSIRAGGRCVAPSVTQTFKLFFNNMSTPLLGDNTFKDVPVASIRPTWPSTSTRELGGDREDAPVYPVGASGVRNSAGARQKRAETYFLPSGQPLPTALVGADLDSGQANQQQLIGMGMKGHGRSRRATLRRGGSADKDRSCGARAIRPSCAWSSTETASRRTRDSRQETIIA